MLQLNNHYMNYAKSKAFYVTEKLYILVQLAVSNKNYIAWLFWFKKFVGKY